MNFLHFSRCLLFFELFAKIMTFRNFTRFARKATRIPEPFLVVTPIKLSEKAAFSQDG